MFIMILRVYIRYCSKYERYLVGFLTFLFEPLLSPMLDIKQLLMFSLFQNQFLERHGNGHLKNAGFFKCKDLHNCIAFRCWPLWKSISSFMQYKQQNNKNHFFPTIIVMTNWYVSVGALSKRQHNTGLCLHWLSLDTWIPSRYSI